MTAAVSSRQKKEGERSDNRAAFPATAAVVDEFRAAFGTDVKLVFAEEGGRTIGRKPREPLRYVSADQWLDASERLVKPELARRAVKQVLGNGRGGR